MSSELVLFLAAGLTGAGCSAMIRKGMIPLLIAAPEVTAAFQALAHETKEHGEAQVFLT